MLETTSTAPSTAPLRSTPHAAAAIAVFSVLGVTVATAIGGFVGIAYGASEACLLRVSRALVDTDEPQPGLAACR
jgi:hypothetical protein